MKNKLKGLFKMTGPKYYKRIISVFIIFLAGIVIPFASVTFMVARRNITHSIDSSNKTVLNQMKYNYTYFSESMANITMSVFYQSDVQALMYNQEIDYYDSYATMRKLQTDIVSKQPSIQSIIVYNAQTKEFYSTEEGGALYGADFLSSLRDEEQVPKLLPILRKVDRIEGDQEIYHHYFSYILYDYLDPTEEGSYIIVNQKANWFLNNMTDAVATNRKTDIYMTSKDGEIFNGSGDVGGLSRTNQYLIQEALNLEADSGFFIDSYEGEKSLVSYIHLGDKENMLLMIQDYKDVFSDVIKLRNEFIVICLIIILLAIGLLIILSRKIYAPIKNLVRYVSDPDKKGEDSKDEFQHLKNQYDYVKLGKLELMKQSQSNKEIIEGYLLNNLLQNSSIEEWENYKERFPQSPILKNREFNACIGLVRIEKNIDTFGFLKHDKDLVLYSVENIMQELLEDTYEVASVINELQDLVLVINCKKEAGDSAKLKQSFMKMQEFVEVNMGLVVSVAHTETTHDITQLSAIYEQAKNLIEYRIIFKNPTIIDMKKCQTNMENKNITYSANLKKNLEEKIKLGNIEEVEEVLWRIYDQVRQLNYNNIMTNGVELLTRINMIINEVNMLSSNLVAISFSEIYEKTTSLEYLEDWFKEIINHIKDLLSETYQEDQKESAKDHIFIHTITEYINKNYGDSNLSSQSIADHIGISSRYLMKKFRDLTGVTLNQYISNIRMEQAVVLLTNTEMSVSEVAESVGIYNDNYFYRLFKKTYGSTPREFSNQMHQK